MKTLVLGDIHGLPIWKRLIDEHKPEKTIFLGDYVDSFNVPDGDMIQNLRDIIEYKKNNMESTVLLFGNHDIQYIYEGNNCSGRRGRIAGILGDLYKENLDLFKICHVEKTSSGFDDDYLFSHAGFTREWFNENTDTIGNWFDLEIDGFADAMNGLLKTRDKDVLFQCGIDRGGYAKTSGPLWIDKSGTRDLKEKFGGKYHQVVGHSHVNKILTSNHFTYCDVLEYGDEKPLILNIE